MLYSKSLLIVVLTALWCGIATASTETYRPKKNHGVPSYGPGTPVPSDSTMAWYRRKLPDMETWPILPDKWQHDSLHIPCGALGGSIRNIPLSIENGDIFCRQLRQLNSELVNKIALVFQRNGWDKELVQLTDAPAYMPLDKELREVMNGQDKNIGDDADALEHTTTQAPFQLPENWSEGNSSEAEQNAIEFVRTNAASSTQLGLAGTLMCFGYPLIVAWRVVKAFYGCGSKKQRKQAKLRKVEDILDKKEWDAIRTRIEQQSADIQREIQRELREARVEKWKKQYKKVTKIGGARRKLAENTPFSKTIKEILF